MSKRKLEDSDDRIRVYCEYKSEEGAPCVCGNREILPSDMQFFGGEVVPYCSIAIRTLKDRHAAYRSVKRVAKRPKGR